MTGPEAGLLASFYDIGFAIAIVLVTYVGGRGHKPVWMGWGVVVMGIGSIIFSLPHFIAPTLQLENVQSQSRVCNLNSTTDTSNCADSSLRNFR